MGHLDNAQQIGDLVEFETYTYCADDNSFWPSTVERNAWACPVALRSELTCALPVTDLYTELFGES